MSTRRSRRAQTGIDREKFDFPADFRSVREGLGTCSGHLKTLTGGLENPDGRSGRAQPELGSEECTRHWRSSHIDALLTVPITASCWAGVVDKAGATMSETCQ